jgi:hypothetical protein
MLVMWSRKTARNKKVSSTGISRRAGSLTFVPVPNSQSAPVDTGIEPIRIPAAHEGPADVRDR